MAELGPKRLTQEYIHTRGADQLCAASPSLANRWGREFDEFVDKRVSGVQVNGVDVIGVDLRHEEGVVHPFALPFLTSPRTTAVVAEYFGPDFRGNHARRERLARVVDTLFPSEDSNTARLKIADELAEVCAEAGKPVVVADIANSPERFLVAEHGFRLLPALPGIYEGLMREVDNVIPAVNDIFPPVKPEWLPYVSAAFLGWEFGLLAQERFRRGMFNPDRVTKAEKLYPDMEHARRMYTATAVERLTADPNFTTAPDEQPAQIVVLEPKAHLLRIEDTLLKPQRTWNRLRSGMYKTVGAVMGLDISMRQWDYKQDGWQMTRTRLRV